MPGYSPGRPVNGVARCSGDDPKTALPTFGVPPLWIDGAGVGAAPPGAGRTSPLPGTPPLELAPPHSPPLEPVASDTPTIGDA